MTAQELREALDGRPYAGVWYRSRGLAARVVTWFAGEDGRERWLMVDPLEWWVEVKD